MSQLTTTPSAKAVATSSSIPWTDRVAVAPVHVLATLWFCAFFLYCNYIPIFHSDIWGHVAYGDWILEHGRLPAEDPFVPLAQGVPVMATAWLGQVILAAVRAQLGPEWISNLFAVACLATSFFLARAFFLQTKSPGLAALGTILVWIVGWSRHAIVRPEIFGSVCFALLLWLVVRADSRRARLAASDRGAPQTALWIGVPLIFAAWANLHGSFIMGFAVLGCGLAGRVLELLARRNRLRSLFTDAELRRWLHLCELAFAGTLVNPYGIDLFVNTLVFPANPNLEDVIEWFPLEMVSYEGIEIGFSWLLAIVVLRHSRARMRPADVLLLAVLALACCLHVRMVTWYAPAAIIVLMPHIADVVRQAGDRLPILGRNFDFQPAIRNPQSAIRGRRSFRYTLCAALAIWCAFSFAPISRAVLGGKPRPPEKLYSHDTPRGVTKFLREHPPAGQIANPQWWGDWLAWDGPAGLRVFMTTNAVHVAPPRVWNDYLAIARGLPGLENRLDRYRVNTVIVQKNLQKRLTQTMRRLPGWKVVYEDDVALVAARGPDVPRAPQITQSGSGGTP